MSADKEELVKFRTSSASESGSRNFMKDSSTLREMRDIELVSDGGRFVGKNSCTPDQRLSLNTSNCYYMDLV